MVTYLLIVRHGENEWVSTNRLAGRTPNVLLNEKGRQQSIKLAAELSKLPIRAIYSSPMERCLETAQPTADKLGLSIQIEEGVIEGDFGEWQGRALKDLAKLPEWQEVQKRPSGFIFPGGESFRNMQFRAVSALERICGDHPNQIVVIFAHSDIIKLCMAHYLGTPLDLFQRIVISTASISAIGFHNHQPSVLYVNRLRDLPDLKIEEKKKTDEQLEDA